jgi:DNA-binding NarL/FixJ family response regulator
MVEGSRQISVVEAACIDEKMLELVTSKSPDIILLCLSENEGDKIAILQSAREINPDLKVVILSDPNTVFDQTAALKLGVAGIVGANQNSRTLIRAIEQVADGEVWLNQKLLSKILDGNHLSERDRKSSVPGLKYEDLTCRELEVVRMIGIVFCNKEISNKLFISEATVRHHLSSIYDKLGLTDRLNLAIYAYQHRIVQPAPRTMKAAAAGGMSRLFAT